MRGDASLLFYVATCISTLLILPSKAKVVPYLQAGFSFDYNGAAASLPITAQCETIHLRWGRGGSSGLPPIAPYSLQIFSSSYSSPFTVAAGSGPTFDWTVPFAPQTQYQICMYDSVGTSGGCEGARTVVPSLTANVSCQNVTSLPTLSASNSLDNPTSPTQTPTINQCDIFSVQPTTGTPPFTLTIAPSGHPPVNITSATKGAIDWTVALPEGFPFFASLGSSDGLFWSDGPFYVGGTGTSDCLSPGTVPKNTFTYSTVGASVGSLIVGLALGAVLMIFVSRRKERRHPALRTPSLSKPALAPELTDFQLRSSRLQESHGSTQYPPPPVHPRSNAGTPPMTPDHSTFLDLDPFAGAPRTPLGRVDEHSSIVPFTDASPSSPHFPLDRKGSHGEFGEQQQQGPARTPSLRSYTTFASTSDLQSSSYASSRSSQTPLMPSSAASTRSSRFSRLGRAPTYMRRPPASHLSVTPVREIGIDDDSMIGPGDVPPQYMRSPAEEEISVSGGALI